MPRPPHAAPRGAGFVLFERLLDVGDLPIVEVDVGLDCLTREIRFGAFQIASQGFEFLATSGLSRTVIVVLFAMPRLSRFMQIGYSTNETRSWGLCRGWCQARQQQCRRFRALVVQGARRQEGADRRSDHRRPSVNAGGMAPGFPTQFCDVEVDPETGKVAILRFVAAQDVGCGSTPPMSRGRSRATSRRASAGPSTRSTCTTATAGSTTTQLP